MQQQQQEEEEEEEEEGVDEKVERPGCDPARSAPS
jgi:hypothetical protein